MLAGKFKVYCDGGVHVIEIDEEGLPHSPDGSHDFDLERSLVELGGEPSPCFAYAEQHKEVVVSALEDILWQLFYLVFDSDQADIDYGGRLKGGLNLPKAAYECEMEVFESRLESIGVRQDDLYTAGREAEELGIDFDSYSSDMAIAGALSINGYPGLQDVLPGDAVVLAEGNRNGHMRVNIEESWVDHGVMGDWDYVVDDDDKGDPDATAETEFFYNWALYTTRNVVNERRRDRLGEALEEAFYYVDHYLTEADSLAAEGRCRDAVWRLRESVHETYKDLDKLISIDTAAEDVPMLPDASVREWAETSRIDLEWAKDIEKLCRYEPSSEQVTLRERVVKFFQDAWAKAQAPEDEE
jgi:hypothetical protein